MRYLTIALTKGRLAKKTLDLFRKVGIAADGADDKDTRGQGAGRPDLRRVRGR